MRKTVLVIFESVEVELVADEEVDDGDETTEIDSRSIFWNACFGSVSEVLVSKRWAFRAAQRSCSSPQLMPL